jgi:NTP pyrophosphatase (non-canonical NTP hydrolase)
MALHDKIPLYTQLQKLQLQLHTWRMRNFPGVSARDQLLGAVEEIGELAHADLKGRQSIRGSVEEHEEEAKDAVADTIIYLMGYCSVRGWDLSSILEETATEVMKRDWIKYPTDGKDS